MRTTDKSGHPCARVKVIILSVKTLEVKSETLEVKSVKCSRKGNY